MIGSTPGVSSIDRRGSERGFTMVETLIAVAVMGTAVVALLSALSTGSIAVTVVEEKVTAGGIARSQLEYTQSLPFQIAPATYATITPNQGYSVTAEAFPVAGTDDDIQRVVVTVYHEGVSVLSAEAYKMNR